MWESRVRCGISKRGGNGGKVGVGLFHRSHRASFPQPSSGFWAILARMPSLGTTGGSIPPFFRIRDRCTFFQILAESRKHYARFVGADAPKPKVKTMPLTSRK